MVMGFDPYRRDEKYAEDTIMSSSRLNGWTKTVVDVNWLLET